MREFLLFGCWGWVWLEKYVLLLRKYRKEIVWRVETGEKFGDMGLGIGELGNRGIGIGDQRNGE